MAGICCGILLQGCGKKVAGEPVSRPNDVPITCVAIMPTSIPVELETSAQEASVKQLREGTQVMDHLLKQELVGPTMRFISAGQVSGLDSGAQGNQLDLARKVGAQLSCNAVLEPTLLRFNDRIGGKLTAKEPASVAFKYRLIELEKGQILCQGEYDEVQQSVSENLFNWSKASKRGFSWVSAEALLQEGLEARLGECSYLQTE
jgi:hypothetical protein